MRPDAEISPVTPPRKNSIRKANGYLEKHQVLVWMQETCDKIWLERDAALSNVRLDGFKHVIFQDFLGFTEKKRTCSKVLTMFRHFCGDSHFASSTARCWESHGRAFLLIFFWKHRCGLIGDSGRSCERGARWRWGHVGHGIQDLIATLDHDVHDVSWGGRYKTHKSTASGWSTETLRIKKKWTEQRVWDFRKLLWWVICTSFHSFKPIYCLYMCTYLT